MARRTKVWTANDGRDKGKQFLITEMCAFDGDRWARRAMSAIARSGEQVPAEIMEAGMDGLKYYTLRSFVAMEFDDSEPLMAEMMQCVEIIPDDRHPNITRPVQSEDIEEVKTILELRSEVFELHTGFSVTAWLSTLIERQAVDTDAETDL